MIVVKRMIIIEIITGTHIEPKIYDCIKYFQDKMNYYGLDVLAHDFNLRSDTEYEIVVGKKGHKIKGRVF
jgi:hypothetical protein